MNKRFFLMAVFCLIITTSCFAQGVPSGSRWAFVIPTGEAESIMESAQGIYESYTVFGDSTLFIAGDRFNDLLKSKHIGAKSFPLRPEESPFLLSSKDPALKQIVFPGVRVIFRAPGFRVVLATETGRMGMASKLSDFTTLEPLPVNQTVLSRPIPPEKKSRREDPLEKLLLRLDREAFLSDVKIFADFKTRSTYSNGALSALDYSEKTMKDLGLKTRRLAFSSSGTKRENLEGFQQGFDTANAGEVIIVGHLDSTSPQASTLAPGADDNGSGAAGVLALARFMKGLNPRASVRYLLVLGEEQGLLGSKAYVANLKPDEIAKIRGVINMDMIGFDNTPPLTMVLETADFNEQMVNQMSDLAKKYTNLTHQITFNYWGSDHVPFLKKSIPTVLTIESEYDDNPTYHQVTDTPEKMNPDLCQGILRLNAAELAELSAVERHPPAISDK